MTRITPDSLRAGMVLAGDVNDGEGRPWLSRGRGLTDQDILAIAQLGCDGVEIEMPESSPSDVPDGKAMMHARHELDDAFRFAGTAHPMMQELHRLCVLRRARRLAGYWR